MIKNIIFDIDGTLAETSKDIINSINNSLKKNKLNKFIHIKEFKKVANLGSLEMIKKITNSSNYNLINKLNYYFLENYEKNICNKSKLKKDALNFLKICKKKGIRLFVSTNKSERHAKILLKKLKILKYFTYVAGRDTFPFKKPNPTHLLFMQIKFSLTKKQTIYIGDTEVDSIIAKKFNLKFILFKNGYTSRNYLSIPHDYLISDFRQIGKMINKVN